MIYIGEIILTLVDQRTWTVEINFSHPWQAVQWSLRVFVGCGELLQLSSDTCWTCESLLGEFEGMTLLNSCLVLKSWPWCCGTFNWLINWTGSWPSQRSLNHLPRVWKLIFTVQVLWSTSVKIISPIYITLFRSFLHLSWWRPLVWGWN